MAQPDQWRPAQAAGEQHIDVQCAKPLMKKHTHPAESTAANSSRFLQAHDNDDCLLEQGLLCRCACAPADRQGSSSSHAFTKLHAVSTPLITPGDMLTQLIDHPAAAVMRRCECDARVQHMPCGSSSKALVFDPATIVLRYQLSFLTAALLR